MYCLVLALIHQRLTEFALLPVASVCRDNVLLTCVFVAAPGGILLCFVDQLFFCASGEQEKVNLSTYDVHCIAGVLKKYLRELPNPLIPVEMYNQFIEASSEWTI